ncbi:hypothetical protein Agub_g16063, partial [Astrephomene gubernaculifera]
PAAQEAGGHVASIIERLATKENNQPGSEAHAKSFFVKDRQPARSILRKPEDVASLEALQDKMTTLAGDLQTFKSQPQTSRRDSLNGRAGLLAPAANAPTPPRYPEALAASLQPAHRAPYQLPHNRHEAQPTQQLISAFPDTSSNHDDDGGLGCHSEGPADDVISIPAGAIGTSKAAKTAAETFDLGIKQIMNEVLTRQLKRTKHGATEQSRIGELADLVKSLRKCVKELGSRITMYIDMMTKVEREGAQQVEAAQLAAQSMCKKLEVEVATVRLNLAQCERESREDKAKLGFDLETVRA